MSNMCGPFNVNCFNLSNLNITKGGLFLWIVAMMIAFSFLQLPLCFCIYNDIFMKLFYFILRKGSKNKLGDQDEQKILKHHTTPTTHGCFCRKENSSSGTSLNKIFSNTICCIIVFFIDFLI